MISCQRDTPVVLWEGAISYERGTPAHVMHGNVVPVTFRSGYLGFKGTYVDVLRTPYYFGRLITLHP